MSVIQHILELPIEIQYQIASFYGGPRGPKQPYLVYRGNLPNIYYYAYHNFRFWTDNKFCRQCGNYRFCSVVSRIRTSYKRDYLSCSCDSTSGKYILAFDLHEELQEACISWVMEAIKGLYGMQKVQDRMSEVSRILQDYQCRITR